MNDSQKNGDAVRIIIADDHPVLRQGLLKIIEAEPKYEVVAETGDGEEALALIRELEPELAILDISMPGKSGLEIVREIRQAQSNTEFIILTMYREEEYFTEAMDQGVKGYILKENASSDLLECIAAVAGGRYYVSASISDYLLKQSGTLAQTAAGPLDRLTEMERRILRLIAHNKTSKEIAAELCISYRTVQNHRSNICNKLELKGYNRLLQFALEHKRLL